MEATHHTNSCTHGSNQLFLCDSEGCFQNLSKVFVCSVCCFTHNHGFLNLIKPSQFQQHCYKLQPLTSLKQEVISQIKAKFAQMKEEIVKNLTMKEDFLIQKIEEILPKEVTEIVNYGLIKGKIQNRFSLDIVKQIQNIRGTQEILLQCRKIVGQFSLNETFLFKNNIFDLAGDNENDEAINRESNEQLHYQTNENQKSNSYQYLQQPRQGQDRLQLRQNPEERSLSISPKAVERIPSTPRPNIPECHQSNPSSLESSSKPIISMIQEPVQQQVSVPNLIKTQKISKIQQNNAKILINLEEMDAPIEISAVSLDNAAIFLRHNLESTDISISIQDNELIESWNENDEEVSIKKFLQSLIQLKNLQRLELSISASSVLSLDNLIDFELALSSLDNLKHFKASYYVEDRASCDFEFSSLKDKIGIENVSVTSQPLSIKH